MDGNEKIVEFNLYCCRCIHEKKKEEEFPCAYCLENPVNYGTNQPVKFEAAEPQKRITK